VSKYYKVWICVEEVDEERDTYTDIDLQFSGCATFDMPGKAIAYAEDLYQKSQNMKDVPESSSVKWTPQEHLMKRAEEDPLGSSIQHWHELHMAEPDELFHAVLNDKTGIGAEWCGLCAYAEADSCDELCLLAKAGFNCHDGRSIYVEAQDAFIEWFELVKWNNEQLPAYPSKTMMIRSKWLDWKKACNQMYSTLINVQYMAAELPKKEHVKGKDDE